MRHSGGALKGLPLQLWRCLTRICCDPSRLQECASGLHVAGRNAQSLRSEMQRMCWPDSHSLSLASPDSAMI